MSVLHTVAAQRALMPLMHAQSVDTVVTPRFPAGLTVVEAIGQWQSRDKRVSRGSSRMLEIIHEDSRDASRRIAEIASEYETRYRQESVLIARGRVEVCF